MAYEKRIELEKPSVPTQRRLLEVKFFAYFQAVIELVEQPHLVNYHNFANEYLERTAILAGVDASVLKTAYGIVNTPAYRPTKYEMVIMARYEGMSYDKIKDMFNVSKPTITNYLNRFTIRNRGELIPSRISQGDYLVIEEALHVLEVTFKEMGKRFYLLGKSKEN